AARTDAGEAGHVGARGVAVQDLQDEQVDGRNRVEDPIPPDVADGRTDVFNGFRGQPAGDFRLDSPNGGEDTTGPPWPPSGGCGTPAFWQEGRAFPTA